MKITYTLTHEIENHDFFPGGMDEQWKCLLCGNSFDEEDKDDCHVVFISPSDETICVDCWPSVKLDDFEEHG